MNNSININVRLFPVRIWDDRTSTASDDTIVLTKEQLQAAQIVGESSRELIHRIYNRRGYRVVNIGKAVKLGIPVVMYANVYPDSRIIVVEGDARVEV